MNMDAAVATRAREAAEDWFARLRAPDCGEAEREAFEAWRAADPSHARAYAATERLWGQLGVLKDAPEVRAYELAALVPAERPPRQSARAPAPRRRWRVPAALAAAVLLAAIGFRLLPAWLEPAPQIHAAADRPGAVVLADGSRVQLDVDTRIAVVLTRHKRDVELQRGRAVFTVAPDAERPFTVAAAGGSVTALGTRFQVWRGDTHVAVTLAEGKVAVRREAAAGHAAQEAELRPGDQLRYALSGAGWELRQVDPEVATSWSDGRLTFRGTPLAEAAAEVNRYSARKIRLADAGLESLRLSGTFRAGDAASVATVLPVVLPVRVEEAADGEIVLHRR